MNLSPALLVSIPLGGAAVLVAFLDRIPRRVTQTIAIAVSALTALGTLAILGDVARFGTRVVWLGGWRPGNHVGLGIAFGIDFAAACVAALVATMVLAATIFSFQYFEEVGTIFYVLILAMLGGMVAFAYAADLFDLFVWYEVFSVAAYALSAYQTESQSAYKGALQFALTNSVAGLFSLVGLTLLEGRTGQLGLVSIGHSLASTPHPDVLVTTALAFVSIGLFTRGALAPMHFWLDELHAAAPAPLSMILGGAMIPLAVYGFVRIYWATFAHVIPPSKILIAVTVGIGAVSALYGAVMTLRETRLKRKLAHATVAHSGVALAAIGAFTIRGLAAAAIYEASFAAAAAALFGTFAILRAITGEYDINMLRGAGRSLPLTSIAFGLATTTFAAFWAGNRAVASTGSPGSATLVNVLANAVAAATGGSFLAAFVRIFLERPRVEISKGERPPWFLLVPALGLAGLSVALAALPVVRAWAARAAAETAGYAVYARAVRYGVRLAHVPLHEPAPGALAWLAPLAAVASALVLLSRATLIRRVRVASARSFAIVWLRGIGGGDSGAYIAWIAASAVAISVAYSLIVPGAAVRPGS